MARTGNRAHERRVQLYARFVANLSPELRILTRWIPHCIHSPTVGLVRFDNVVAHFPFVGDLLHLDERILRTITAASARQIVALKELLACHGLSVERPLSEQTCFAFKIARAYLQNELDLSPVERDVVCTHIRDEKK